MSAFGSSQVRPTAGIGAVQSAGDRNRPRKRKDESKDGTKDELQHSEEHDVEDLSPEAIEAAKRAANTMNRSGPFVGLRASGPTRAAPAGTPEKPSLDIAG